MKKILIFLLLFSIIANSQVTTPYWTTGGITATSSHWFGTRNNFPIYVKVNNNEIGRFTANGLSNFNFEYLTQTEIDNIFNPKIGRKVFNTTTNREMYFDGTLWIELGPVKPNNGLQIDPATGEVILGGTLNQTTNLNLNEQYMQWSDSTRNFQNYPEETYESITNGTNTSTKSQSAFQIKLEADGNEFSVGSSEIRIRGINDKPVIFSQEEGLFEMRGVLYDYANEFPYLLATDQAGKIKKTNNNKIDGSVCYQKNTSQNLIFINDLVLPTYVDMQALMLEAPINFKSNGTGICTADNTGYVIQGQSLGYNCIVTAGISTIGTTNGRGFNYLYAPNLQSINDNLFENLFNNNIYLLIPLALHTSVAVQNLQANNTVTLIDSDAIPTNLEFKKVTQNRNSTYYDANGLLIEDPVIIALYENYIKAFVVTATQCSGGGSGGIALTDLSATAPLNYNNTSGVFSMPQASTTTSGYLQSSDFTIFNNKQDALTLTTNGNSGTATLVGSTLNIPNYASALWVTTNTDPTATSNTGTLPRFEDNTNNTAKWYIDTNGVAKRIEYRKVSGSIMAANACVNTIVHVPNGTPNSTKTVGTGGDFSDLATALASATVVNGTILKVLNDLTITATVNVNKAVVIDFNSKVISSSTTLPVNMFNITAGATLKNGTLSHLKTTNTSVETIVSINSPTAPVYIYNNIFNIQEFAIATRGQFYIGKNTFNYIGASLTNSHRFIILYGNSGESRIYENKYTGSAKQGTTRYTNFLLATSTTGTAYSGKLYINNNTQMGGDLRQFFMHEAGIPTSMELYVAHNTFNDFNGGIGFLDPTIYNGYSKIGIYSNTQGGDAVGNYKGVLYVDGTGAINENTILEYADNTQGTTALRADYVSYATDNSTEIAIKNTVTFVNKKVKQTIEEAENNLGVLVQQLKNTKTYISGATGVGTESDPYVVTSSSGGTNALWTTATTNPTATSNTGTLPRFVENTVNGSKWYIDSTGSAKIIEANTVSAQVVYINSLSPIGATIFDTENPPVTNNNALKNLDNALYIATNGSTWNSNGTTYSTYTIPEKTPWLLGGTASTDAGADKTNSIYRKGRVLISTNGSTQTTPLKDLHLQNGGTSLLTSAFGSGQIFSTNDSSGPRFFLEHLGAGTNLKTSVMYTQNGITYLGAIVTDNGSTWLFANPLNINHSTGFVGINTTSPLSNLESNGSFGANIITTGASAYTLISRDYTVVLITSGAVVTLGSSVTNRIVNIKNGSTGSITITGHIDNVNSATLTIPAGQSRTLHGNGTTWWII